MQNITSGNPDLFRVVGNNAIKAEAPVKKKVRTIVNNPVGNPRPRKEDEDVSNEYLRYLFGDDEDDDDEEEVIKVKKPKKKKKAKKAQIKEVKKEKTPDPEKERIKREKAEKKRQENKTKTEITMIQLIARRDMLNKQLNSLNPAKPKDSKVIAAINIELVNIREELNRLSKESGIALDNINSGTRFGRFMNRVKDFGHRVVKKAKKFFKRNKELVVGVASIVVPFIASFFVRTIFHL